MIVFRGPLRVLIGPEATEASVLSAWSASDTPSGPLPDNLCAYFSVEGLNIPRYYVNNDHGQSGCLSHLSDSTVPAFQVNTKFLSSARMQISFR